MKRRYATLDALRGLAATLVVIMHSWPLDNPSGGVTGNLRFGYLAVDLFFVLSGFVIGFRYDPGVQERMSRGEFMLRRIIRLYPLFVIGYLIGAVPFLLHLFTRPVPGTLPQLAFNLFALPSPTEHDSPALLPIISPAWSLFAEFYIANALYALLWRRMTTPVLLGVVFAGAVGLGAVELAYGTMDVGALWNGAAGLVPRVVFSFFLGVLIQRVRGRRPSLPSWTVLAACGLLLAPPLSGIAGQVYELVCVAVFFPVLIWLGAGAFERYPKFGSALGDTSYAVYILHIPLMLLVLKFMPRLNLQPSFPLGCGFVIASLALAYVVQERVDQPVRRWLTDTRKAREVRAQIRT